MISQLLHPQETERLRLLKALELLDTPPEPVFDRVTRLAARALGVPITLVTLVDEQRQWFKSRVGVDLTETPRSQAFCAHAILGTEPMVVPDAQLDARFAANPLVTGGPGIRFYAGVPLLTQAGLPMGTLCAIDDKPRTLTPDELDTLRDLAGIVMQEIQLRETLVLARTRLTQVDADMASSEARFRAVFERAAVGIATVAPDGRWLGVNDALCNILGYSADELKSLTFQDITHPEDIDADLQYLQDLVSGKIERYEMEKRYLRRDGSSTWARLSVAKKLSATGELEYFVSVVQNIQARKTAEAALAALRHELEQRVEARTAELRISNEQLSQAMAQQARVKQVLRKREAELSAVIENASDAFVSIDHHSLITAWNRQAEATFGWRADEAIGRSLSELIIPPEHRAAHHKGMLRYLRTGVAVVLDQRIELPAQRRDGSSIPVEVRIRSLEIDGQILFNAFLHDISERKAAEAEREQEARHDPVTGLPNRRALMELLPQAMARTRRSGTALAVIFLDLDGFKQVNDNHGHDAGDALLHDIAQRLRRGVRECDTVVRLAGDEFVIVLEGLGAAGDEALPLAQKLLGLIAPPVRLGAAAVHVSASIGVALHLPAAASVAADLMKRADAAMYEAKRAGKAQVRVA